MGYSKGNEGGTVEIRLNGPARDIIAEFLPAKTRRWSTFLPARIGLEDVDGVHDVTFVGKNGRGIFDLASFELSDFADRAGHYSMSIRTKGVFRSCQTRAWDTLTMVTSSHTVKSTLVHPVPLIESVSATPREMKEER